jgi:GTP-binding protein HflX
MTLHETKTNSERSLLVGVVLKNENRWEIEEHLDELTSLAQTAGAEVIQTIIQERERLDPAFFIGRGKAEELSELIEELEISLIIFDDELAPAQVKNLEQLTGVKIIDRTALILDIFAAHARTKQARTQVELAQLNYYLPRLTRQWSHLSRQVGGIGTKGPGETQLETDRRLVRTRISHLNDELIKIEKQQEVQRRKAHSFIRVALVGYTNAGKSTLLNALTQAKTLVQDKLFATLDTTVRRMELNEGVTFLLSDTVGFIRKLPHHLIASFQTTLAQTIESDLLLHVVDVSDPMYVDHIQTVQEILKELRIFDKPMLSAMNKVDRIKDQAQIQVAHQKYPDALFISAKKQIRMERLKEKIYEFALKRYDSIEFKLNYSDSKKLARLDMLCHILDRRYEDNGIYLRIRYAKENEALIRAIIKNNSAA